MSKLLAKSDQIKVNVNEREQDVDALNQHVLSEWMIPGKYQRYFKPKRRRVEEGLIKGEATDAESIPDIVQKAPFKHSATDATKTPTVLQKRYAQQTWRALDRMYASDALPSRYVTKDFITIDAVEISPNLKRCNVLYSPMAKDEKQKKHIISAMDASAAILSRYVKQHADFRRPIRINFLPCDKQHVQSVLDAIAQDLGTNP
ncbi:hypothetical protein BZG36_01571 [Bifiguratus adelaidae]|uniref:Uncharacterized protein n=1 Tax=Bifiguratus adelaidae TaxID=1938954 RepID=A0A261Y4E8_9FUNG|nr:hypothetical protein BZG36_01571 [Bifiguratus adelaidae]